MDLADLYRDVIVDHNRAPRNFRKLTPADREAQGFNALCGDKLTVYARLDGERLAEVAFEGSGCAISVASASLMSERVKGLTLAEARALHAEVHDLLAGPGGVDPQRLDALGKVAALAGVRAYPSRVKCATLAWHTLLAALDQTAAPVSTE
jgi:nitrogen fixation NifU-like protein